MKGAKIYVAQKLNAAIIGGGNIGTHFACVLANKGFDVNIYTSRPGEWHNLIEAHNDDGSIITGKISLASDDIAKVLSNREIIFICVMLRGTRKVNYSSR